MIQDERFEALIFLTKSNTTIMSQSMQRNGPIRTGQQVELANFWQLVMLQLV